MEEPWLLNKQMNKINLNYLRKSFITLPNITMSYSGSRETSNSQHVTTRGSCEEVWRENYCN